MSRRKFRKYRQMPLPGDTGECQLVAATWVDGDLDYCLRHDAYLLDCLQCGKMYHAKRCDSKWCSPACKQKAYRERKKCEQTLQSSW